MTHPRQRLPARLAAAIGPMIANIRENKNLQIGLILIFLILCSEALLRWSDNLAGRMKALEEARGELRDLRKQSGNEATLKTTLEELSEARENLENRLWQIPSEAQGQARMKDWLLTTFKQTAVAPFNLKIANPRPVAKNTESDTTTNTPATAETAAKFPAGLHDLREFRATFSIAFTPADIEKLLAEIEGGQAVAEVETLTISLRDRRAELSVRVLARLTPSPEKTTDSARPKSPPPPPDTPLREHRP